MAEITIKEAFDEFAKWESWLSEKTDGLLDDLNMEQRAVLYALMCEIAPCFEWSIEEDA